MASKKKSRARWFAVWPTAWGPIGAAATEQGVSNVVLPHYQPDDLADLLAWEHPNAQRSEAPFEALIAASRAYFNARPADFADVAVDLPAEDTFGGMVYRACRDIPYGQTRSYLDLAKAIGRPDAARAVATMMSKNPTPLVVPCHRVTYSSGRAGGFSAAGGVQLKQRMLELERGD
jgi:methylated-DNA-[protein]-cysteine S-methyltransferase